MNDSPLDPYAPFVAPPSAEPVDAAAPPGTSSRRPRVWTVFAAFVLALAAIIGVQVVGAIVLLLWIIQQGTTLQEAPDQILVIAGTPEFFIGMALPSQLVLLVTALVAGWLSPMPLKMRLGLNRPTAALSTVVYWVAGAAVPFLIGLGAAWLLTIAIPPDPSVAQLYRNMNWQIAIPFVLFIAIAPGLSEEFLFRGYMQRRLTERWPASVGILVTSLLFAVVHVMPHSIVFALPVGIWLGLMAWRCDSVWPGVICHALINGLWNVWQVGVSLKVFSEDAEWPLLIAVGCVGLMAFALACWDLATCKRQRQPAAA